MNLYFVKTPKFISSFYKDCSWKINTNKKEIYLTFDDGPTPLVTNFVLDTLAAHNIKATFFSIGKNIEKHPEIFSKIVSQGHSVGNHTFNHLNGWQTKTDSYVEDVEKAQRVITDAVGLKAVKIFRPPYGRIKKEQIKSLKNKGYKIIMWSVLSGDFDVSITVKKCYDNVISNPDKGNLIVFHDSKKAFEVLKNVLPKMITHYKNIGFTFKAL